MPLPVIANTWRVRLLWNNYEGVRPVNVIHVGASSGDEADIANKVQGALAKEMFGCMNVNYQIDAIGVTKLNGVNAELIFAQGTPVTGNGGSGEQIPAVAGIVSLKTLVRGPKGRGRVYIGPMVEASNVNGHLSGGDITSMQTAWDEFSVDLSEGAIVGQLLVASYKHASAAAVASIQVKSLVGTQRRRQGQLT